jgi:hypothetical protein
MQCEPKSYVVAINKPPPIIRVNRAVDRKTPAISGKRAHEDGSQQHLEWLLHFHRVTDYSGQFRSRSELVKERDKGERND